MERVSYRDGFTLVELSIVLVIIGLIVGAVVGGRSLIRQAELRSVITEVQGYKSAIRAFELQYDALPGDFPDASGYWGISVAANGNADGKVTDGDGEQFHIWTHLTEAKIIPGSYPYDGGLGEAIIGTSVPPSKLHGAGWGFEHGLAYRESPSSKQKIAHRFAFGGADPGYNEVRQPVLSSVDAHAIDVKIDDGVADSGKVLTMNGFINGTGYTTGCVTNATEWKPSNYVLSNTDKTCRMFFWFD